MPGRGPAPTECDHPIRKLDDVNDAVFCPACDGWLEEVCSDPECDFCTRRPERPSLETRPREVTTVPPLGPRPDKAEDAADSDEPLQWFSELLAELDRGLKAREQAG
ncbi:MAG: hypothetical protein H6724_10355 [Sandaracinus sp.]|nr:hypothetical protein [Sandaracinus sp.]